MAACFAVGTASRRCCGGHSLCQRDYAQRACSTVCGRPVQARLKINQAVTLRNSNGRWCEITASALERPGYTDCQYLARQALTLAAIETETADLILELNRLAARSRHDLPSESVDWGWAYEKSPVEFQRIFEQLFQQFEKHFALSPSLRTYVDYERLLAGLTWLPAHSLKPMPGKLEALYKARAEQLRAMRKALTADFSSGSTPLVRRAITATLGEVLEARQAARYTEQSRLSQKAERSFSMTNAGLSAGQEGRSLGVSKCL